MRSEPQALKNLRVAAVKPWIVPEETRTISECDTHTFYAEGRNIEYHQGEVSPKEYTLCDGLMTYVCT